jgi:hypothetical protein
VKDSKPPRIKTDQSSYALGITPLTIPKQSKSPERVFNEFSNDIQRQNICQDSSSKPSTEQLVNNSSADQGNTAAADITKISNNDNSIYNTIEINSNNIKDSSLCTQTVTTPLSNTESAFNRPNLPVIYTATTNNNQINLNSNKPYRPLKCVASDASDAPYRKGNQNGKTKAEQVGFPDIPCLYCAYKDPLDFDLSLHYMEKHRQHLIRLSLGMCSIDDRADYAVELSKRKLFESLNEDNRGDEEGDDEGDE